MKHLYLIILYLSFSSVAFPKILIFTFAYNRPDFIEIQYLTFKKFLLDEFELIVFSDACKPNDKQAIEEMCQKHSLTCIPIPQEIHARPYFERPPLPLHSKPLHQDDIPWVQYFEGKPTQDPAVRNSNVCQYALDMYGFYHDDIVMLVDSDLFLIKELNIRDFLQDHHAASSMRTWEYLPNIYYNFDIPQGTTGIDYFWIGILMINMNTIPNKYALNLNRGIVATPLGTAFLDTAAYCYYLLQLTQNIKIKAFDRLTFNDIICEDCKTNSAECCTHNSEILQKVGVSKKLIPLLQAIPIDTRVAQKDIGIELLLQGSFMHYRGGTNWQAFSQEFLKKKNAAFKKFIKKILK